MGGIRGGGKGGGEEIIVVGLWHSYALAGCGCERGEERQLDQQWENSKHIFVP
jgi:hypothetical protein